jgi:hypothetical protein
VEALLTQAQQMHRGVEDLLLLVETTNMLLVVVGTVDCLEAQHHC